MPDQNTITMQLTIKQCNMTLHPSIHQIQQAYIFSAVTPIRQELIISAPQHM